MPQNKYLTFHISFLFMGLNPKFKIKSKRLVPLVVSSLEFSHSPKLGNTAKFFKKLAFIGLAFGNIMFDKCRIATIRSVIASLWDMIATYAVIF